MNVWMRGRSECLTAFQAASMSCAAVRARPQITGPSTAFAIAATASASPGEVIGNPASMMSTPSRASWWAISSFSCTFSEMPGDCSPSRSVVSKMYTLVRVLAVTSRWMFLRALWRASSCCLLLLVFSYSCCAVRAGPAACLFPPKGEEKKEPEQRQEQELLVETALRGRRLIERPSYYTLFGLASKR